MPKPPSNGSSAFLAVAVRLPKEMVAEVDAIVTEIQGAAPGVRVSRSDAMRILLGEALNARRQRAGGLRERVLTVLRGQASSLADVREHMADVGRDVLEATLLELDREGTIILRSAQGRDPTPRERAAAFRDPQRGELVYVDVPAATAAPPATT